MTRDGGIRDACTYYNSYVMTTHSLQGQYQTEYPSAMSLPTVQPVTASGGRGSANDIYGGFRKYEASGRMERERKSEGCSCSKRRRRRGRDLT
jgi:hypothetical protein